MTDSNPSAPSGGYGAPPPPGGYGYGGPGGQPPPNHLVWAILSTIFCCLPLGIASIVFAAQVNQKYASGDLAGAQVSSEKARRFALWGTMSGVALIVVFIVVVAMFGSVSFQVGTTAP